MTTPNLLAALVERDALDADRAQSTLDDVAAARTWTGNADVTRTKELLDP